MSTPAPPPLPPAAFSLKRRLSPAEDAASMLAPPRDEDKVALVFEDGTRVEGISFGARRSVA